MAAPGHTPGTIAFFFDAEENGRVCKVGMHGGVGTNSMKLEWLSGYGLSPDCRQKFIEGLDKLMNVPVEVFLGNHTWNNNTMGKYQRSLTEQENPFIDPEGWKEFLLDCKTNIEQMIAENI
jgi:metallo-beta-lactamase class B